MNVYAFLVEANKDGKIASQIFMEVDTDMVDAWDKVEKKVASLKGVDAITIKQIKHARITLQEYVIAIKPQLERLVKTAKAKSELMDAISQLPIT